MLIVKLKEKLSSLPDEAGVYMMKDHRGEIIYVGKAKILKKRVGSYFVGVLGKDLKTQSLVREVIDFDIMITKNETEAILLERTLIKHHHPRYNIMLKDGKEYPFLRVDFSEDWPRIEKVRRRKDDDAFYLGPFSHAGSLNTSFKLMGRIFPLIRCTRNELRNAKRPCNYYHMKMCLGPCTLPVNRDDYVALIRNALAFIMGKNQEVADDLESKMHLAAKAENFELAATLRDQLLALQEISKRQSVVVKDLDDADIIAFIKDDDQTAFCVLMVRDGRIIGHDTFMVATPIGDDEEIERAFLMQYYERRLPPQEIIVHKPSDAVAEILDVLGPLEIERTKRIKLTSAARGDRKSLWEMSLRNARYFLEEQSRQKRSASSAVESVAKLCGLPIAPRRIECIDVSHIQGTNVVASVVCFIDGKPAKDQYRHYNIKSLAPGQQNDFASVAEIVGRRLERGSKEDDLPDLLIIDGGKGQLNAALEAAEQFPDLKIPIISIAKSRSEYIAGGSEAKTKKQQSFERIFLPREKDPIVLKVASPEFRLITSLRDEAHRFAINFHRKKRSKASLL